MKIPAFWLFVLLCLTSACGGLTKQRSLQKQNTLAQQQLYAQQVSTGLYHSLWLDSSTTLLEVMLQPTGRFSYSADSGFRGEAAQLSIRKRQQQGSQQVAMAQQSASAQVQLQQQQRSQQQLVHKQQHKEGQLPWLLLLAVYGYWRYRKL